MAELLLHIGDSPTSSWHDGDIMQAVRDYDALRVHAELIVRERSMFKTDALPALKKTYEAITRGKNRVLPVEEDLEEWWERADHAGGINRASCEQFP